MPRKTETLDKVSTVDAPLDRVSTNKNKVAYYKPLYFICLLTLFLSQDYAVSSSETRKGLQSAIELNPTLSKDKKKLPPCPLFLNRKNVKFKELIKECNYDRSLLPPCEKNLSSLDLENNTVKRERRGCTKEWTIIVFIAGDEKKLSHYVEMDMEELFYSKVEDAENHFDLLVEIDTFRQKSKRYAFEKVPGEERVGAITGKDFIYEEEQNTGEPKVLEDFLAWAIESFPARHYMLVLGGHGDGWASFKTGSCEISREIYGASFECSPRSTPISQNRDHPNFMALDGGNSKNNGLIAARNFINIGESNVTRLGKGIAYDESHDDWLSVTQLKQLLTRTRKIFMGGAKFDLYAADACLMQQAEVVFELREQAKFIYGSLPVFPAQGLPYDSILKNFAAKKYTKEDPLAGAEILAKDLPTLVKTYYEGLENSEAHKKLVISVLRTEDLKENFLSELNKLGAVGLEWLEEERKNSVFMTIQRAFYSNLSKIVHFQDSIYDMKSMLQAWKELLSEEEGFSKNKYTAKFIEQMEVMEKSLEAITLSFVSGENYTNQALAGLSIWLPKDLLAYNSFAPYIARSSLHRYSNENNLWKLNNWSQFLKHLFSSSSI